MPANASKLRNPIWPPPPSWNVFMYISFLLNKVHTRMKCGFAGFHIWGIQFHIQFWAKMWRNYSKRNFFCKKCNFQLWITRRSIYIHMSHHWSSTSRSHFVKPSGTLHMMLAGNMSAWVYHINRSHELSPGRHECYNSCRQVSCSCTPRCIPCEFSCSCSVGWGTPSYNYMRWSPCKLSG